MPTTWGFPLTYDGTDISDETTCGVTDTDAFGSAPTDAPVQPFGAVPGGILPARIDRSFPVTVHGWVSGATPAAAMTVRDSLVNLFRRPRCRLALSPGTDARYRTVTLVEFSAAWSGRLILRYTAKFVSEEPHARAATPSADVRTLSFAGVPGEATGYRQQIVITPGGSGAPAPLRAIIANQAGSSTPALWSLTNRTQRMWSAEAIPAGVGVSTTASVPPGQALVIDGERGEVWVGPSGLALWVPGGDAVGPVLDMSGQSRDLTAAGTVTYRQDGPDILTPAYGFDGSTGYLSTADAGLGLTGSVSFGIWVNADTIGAAMGAIGRAAANAGYSLRVTAAGVAQAGVGDGTTTRTATGQTIVGPANWFFLVVTHNATTGTLSLYVDATLDAQTAGGAFSPAAAGNPLRVAAAHNLSGTAEFWAGRLAGWFVYPGVLTQSQIASIYRRGLWALGQQQPFFGAFPSADPVAGPQNVIDIRADGASAPAARAVLGWRSRFA